MRKKAYTKAYAVATSIYLILSSEKGEAKFDSALQIVISFVIGALVLTALASIFDNDIIDWLESVVGDWFNTKGALPVVPSKSP